MAKKKGKYGAVAAGHEETALAAMEILKAGGNAFDAAVAAMATACVTEPVLASLGGGGFLLARKGNGSEETVLYDFFTQTPKIRKPAEDVEFFPILADFGTATQEFHIGAGACATPGMTAGISSIQNDLCRMSPAEHFSHAISLARQGVRVNDFQSFLFGVVAEIYKRDPESVSCFGDGGELAPLGGILKNPDLADTLEALGREGQALFSQGQISSDIHEFSQEYGGHLTSDDLKGYEVE